MQNKGYFYAAISALTYGLIPIFIIPVKSSGYSLDQTLFYRFFISFIFVFAYLIFKKISLKLTKFETLIMLILGLFYALSSEFLFLGYEYLSAGIASTILFVYPVIVALIMWIVYKEKISKSTSIALVLSLSGIVVLSAKESIANINFVGLSVAVLSAVFYALYMVIVSKAKISFSGMKVTMYSLLFSSFYYLTKVFITGDSIVVNATFIFDTTIFAFITTVISMATLIQAIKLIGSTQTSIMGALEPAVAVGVSVYFFQEDFTLNLFLGLVLIISGVVLNILADKKEVKI